MDAGEKGNREFGFLLYEFREMNPQSFGGPQSLPILRKPRDRPRAERRATGAACAQEKRTPLSGVLRSGAKTGTRMRHIDLIDWTSAANQLSVDYAKPHLQLLCISGVQISLDAFSGSNPEI